MECEDFEESVVLACRFVRAGDPRIGKIPAARRMAKKSKKKVASKKAARKKKTTLKRRS